MSRVIDKYLQHYAEAEVRLLCDFPSLQFNHAIVIPAYREEADFVHRILEGFGADVLLILVINQPDTDTDTQPQQRLLEQICEAAEKTWQGGHLGLYRAEPGQPAILTVNCFEPPLPAKQGVGLARKIGADMAVALFQKGVLASHWVHASDADARLPLDYFERLSQVPTNHAAYVYPFVHCGDASRTTDLTRLYERALNYYVAGLVWAGSVYAFHTIGSTLAFDVNAYCQVRGFPKRSAGEDFYLLNKLAKVGLVKRGDGAPLRLQARLSDRVPFGTGPAVQKMAELSDPEHQYLYYHPGVFIAVRELLQIFARIAQNPAQRETALTGLPDLTRKALIAVGWEKFCAGQDKQNANAAQWQRQLEMWFDAFKTLKFIHFLRDNGLPDMPLHRALIEAPFDSPAQAE